MSKNSQTCCEPNENSQISSESHDTIWFVFWSRIIMKSNNSNTHLIISINSQETEKWEENHKKNKIITHMHNRSINYLPKIV